MNNIFRAPSEERLISRSTERLGKKLLLEPEQKAVELIIDLVQKLCKAESLVMDSCTGPFATAKTYLRLSEQRMFLEWENTLCVSSGCASIVCGSVWKTGSECGLQHCCEREGGQSKEGLRKEDCGARVEKRGLQLNCAIQTYPSRNNLCKYNAFCYDCVQACYFV